VSGGSNKIHKVLKPFSVVDVRGPPIFEEVQWEEDVAVEDDMIGRPFLSATDVFRCANMPQRDRPAPKRPTPVLSLFSANHSLRENSESGGRQTAR